MKIQLTVLALLAVVTTAQAQTPAPAPAGDPAKGRALYRSTGCWQCHGSEGHGGAWQGPKLAPEPLEFETFLYQLRRPMNSMPPYRASVLSDADAADIHAYLKSIPAGPSADQIDLLPRR